MAIPLIIPVLAVAGGAVAATNFLESENAGKDTATNNKPQEHSNLPMVIGFGGALLIVGLVVMARKK